jgi:hypothetical protein
VETSAALEAQSLPPPCPTDTEFWMDRRVITSTSRSSAQCSDIVVRDGITVRLVFRPELVDNPHDESAAVRGTFIYQRKGPRDAWLDSSTIPLSTLKKAEGFKLELHAAEVLTLFRELAALYKIHARHGIPLGVTELVRVDSAVASLTALPRDQIRTYLSANRAVGEELLSSLLSWAAELQEPAALVPRLVGLGPAALRNLNVAVGLESLKLALEIWIANAWNSDEEFWQQTLTEHSFVLEQVFAWPTMIVKDKAYVGGKSILNTGGNIVDFLVKNYLTSNAALVEIKTPVTKLLARRYRDAVYNVSEDLGGAVMQVLNYRFSLQRDFYSLTHGLPGGLEAFEPRCVVIIGTTEELNSDESKTRSLELFRSHLPSVAVITFDELFEKTRRLVNVLEASP